MDIHRELASRRGVAAPLAPPNVLACGPVPARTAGLPDGDGTRVGRPDGDSTSVGRPDGDGTSVGRPCIVGIRGGRPVRRNRPIAAGRPLPCGRDRPAGRYHGSVWPEYPVMGAQAGGGTNAAAHVRLKAATVTRIALHAVPVISLPGAISNGSEHEPSPSSKIRSLHTPCRLCMVLGPQQFRMEEVPQCEKFPRRRLPGILAGC